MDQEPRTTSVFSLSTLVFPHTKQFFSFFYSGWKMNKTMMVPEVNILTLHTFLIPFLMRMLALTLSNEVYCSVYETFANITFDYVYNGFIILLFYYLNVSVTVNSPKLELNVWILEIQSFYLFIWY